MHKPSAHLYAFLPKHFWRKILVIWPNHRPALNPCQIKIVHILQATIAKITKQGVRGSDKNGGLKVVGLGTDHRLSLAQNPILLAGQIAILFASSRLRGCDPRSPFQASGRHHALNTRHLIAATAAPKRWHSWRSCGRIARRTATQNAMRQDLDLRIQRNVRPARWSFDTKPTPIESKSFTHQIILQSA